MLLAVSPLKSEAESVYLVVSGSILQGNLVDRVDSLCTRANDCNGADALVVDHLEAINGRGVAWEGSHALICLEE